MSGAAAARLTVALTFDHDAIAAEVMRGDGPVARSRGEFGPRVGAPRVLELLARHQILATWFVPGHTLVSFPESVRAILEAGHELACHGWAHEDLATVGPGTQRELLERSRDAIGEVGGRPPAGFRAPYWSLSEETLDLVEELGFAYDSSLMDDDFRLHRIRRDDRHTPDGSELGAPGRLVEVPISWSLDDWPHFEPGRTGVGPLSAPSKVEEIWVAELEYAHGKVAGGVLTLTMHPEAIGRASRIAMLERFVERAASLEGVVFDRLDRIVERWVATES
ncbi:MAG TPA: polysaccharide deacetylase [Candidatus Limnocylindrales bacterium]|nr:polysaccharide deacetylase [Candidatus Limnocylindrales bacterium]